jgi:hypothetical protein
MSFHTTSLGPTEDGEWGELFNQQGIKVDVSGWRIDCLASSWRLIPPRRISPCTCAWNPDSEAQGKILRFSSTPAYLRASHSASEALDFWYSIIVFHPPSFTKRHSKWMYSLVDWPSEFVVA